MKEPYWTYTAGQHHFIIMECQSRKDNSLFYWIYKAYNKKRGLYNIIYKDGTEKWKSGIGYLEFATRALAEEWIKKTCKGVNVKRGRKFYME